MKDKFTKTYTHDLWKNGESKSGTGSNLDYTINYRKHLIDIMKKEKVTKIFDTSCGDWNWMKEIKNDLPTYIGNDIVEPMIEENNKKYCTEHIKFVCSDALSKLKTFKDNDFDLIICRHTLEHLPTSHVIDILHEIKRVGKSAIITSSSGNNHEIANFNGVQGRPVNLNKSPYKEIVGEVCEIFLDTKGNDLGTYTTESNGCFGYFYRFV